MTLPISSAESIRSDGAQSCAKPCANGPVVQVGQVDHVAIVVADIDATERFYVDVLGMELVSRPAFAFDGRWFQAGSTLVHAILQHDASGPAGEQFGEFSRISRTQHMAFAVDDAVACAEALRSHDIEIVAGPKGRPDGAAQTVIQDPDGYVIELVSETGGETLAVEGGRA